MKMNKCKLTPTMNLLAGAKEEKSSRRHSSPSSCSKQSASNVIGQRIKRLGDNRRCMGNSRILFGGMVFYAMIVGTVGTTHELEGMQLADEKGPAHEPTPQSHKLIIDEFKDMRTLLDKLGLCDETKRMLGVENEDVLEELASYDGGSMDNWKPSAKFEKVFQKIKEAGFDKTKCRFRRSRFWGQENIPQMMKLIYACRPLIRGFMINLNTGDMGDIYKLESWEKVTIQAFTEWVNADVGGYKASIWDLEYEIIRFFLENIMISDTFCPKDRKKFTVRTMMQNPNPLYRVYNDPDSAKYLCAGKPFPYVMPREQSPRVKRAPRSPPARTLIPLDHEDHNMNENPLNPLYNTMKEHKNFEAYLGTKKDYEKLCQRRDAQKTLPGLKGRYNAPIVD